MPGDEWMHACALFWVEVVVCEGLEALPMASGLASSAHLTLGMLLKFPKPPFSPL